MSRVLAVDWGTKRLGMAISDPDRILARPLPTLTLRPGIRPPEAIAETARREEAGLILLGLPLNMDGSEGSSARRVRALGQALETAGYPVAYADERLTSETAQERLREQGVRRPPKDRVDQMAALILLQEYLDGEGAGRA